MILRPPTHTHTLSPSQNDSLKTQSRDTQQSECTLTLTHTQETHQLPSVSLACVSRLHCTAARDSPRHSLLRLTVKSPALVPPFCPHKHTNTNTHLLASRTQAADLLLFPFSSSAEEGDSKERHQIPS